MRIPISIQGLSRRDLFLTGATASLLMQSAASASQQPQKSSRGLDARLPFSRYGSYWAVSQRWMFGATPDIPGGAWYIRLLEDDASPSELFRLELHANGSNLQLAPHLTPSKLTFSGSFDGEASFVVAEPDVLRIRGRGCTLRLYGVKGSYGYAIQQSGQSWEVMADGSMPRVQVKALHGELKVSAPWRDEDHKASCLSITMDLSPNAAGVFECAMHYYDAIPRRDQTHASFDEAENQVQEEFKSWSASLQELSPDYQSARETAAYVLWSSIVAPRGLYRTPVVWCSKSWMNRIWSWDHCFVAVGLASAHDILSWQQFCLFRDMQDPASGMCADWFSNVRKSWLCTKPPVHGWALRHLLLTMPDAVAKQRIQEIYEPLCKWTQFWLTERNLDGDGLPYILNPNESFDNTTANTLDAPVKAPEIAAYLTLQLEALAGVATRLGYRKDAAIWQSKARSTLNELVRVLWDGNLGCFRARRIGDGQTGDGDCIFSFVPLVLGRRLPGPIAQSLIRGVAEPGRFLTPYGLSTESLRSPHYNGDSYVKGPIWAPPNVFITEGLDELDSRELASKIRKSFLRTCVLGGMSEHFDAHTGAAQGDPGYNWTAAMFLHFAAQEELTRSGQIP